ncbi:alpha/beta fold hydrolase [Mycolicibacter icosiumassiliensis]|uniref:alpha/beta fold hydrolase n=1 Tax=Mycolicibacter icosiumassiliensis TaxID=1792835 RepID=UPI0008318387|nr:alpha/beta hydrolase [Mycolicibacter icosiumassiliensis]
MTVAQRPAWVDDQMLPFQSRFVDVGGNLVHSMLIIWGDGDFAFGDNELRRWEQALTDQQTVIGNGAGHFVPSDASEHFVAAIRDWHTPSGP